MIDSQQMPPFKIGRVCPTKWAAPAWHDGEFEGGHPASLICVRARNLAGTVSPLCSNAVAGEAGPRMCPTGWGLPPGDQTDYPCD